MSFSKPFYLLGLALIVVVSFLFFGSINDPLMNSDDGVGVLMTHYLDFPHDIYFWGQDRLGSLIPLISQVWTKGLGMSPLMAYSFTNYLLLTLGFVGFSTFFRDNTTKLLFALLWFFPYHHFADLLHYPIGIGYSIIGSSILLIRLLDFDQRSVFYWKNHLLLLLLVLWLGAGIWMSDLVVINLCGLLFAYFIYRWKTQRKWFPRPEVIFWTLVGAACWGAFIVYAKVNAPSKTPDFQSFNTLSDAGRAFGFLYETTLDLFTGKGIDLISTIYPWLILLLFALYAVLYFRGKIRLTQEARKWVFFLRLDFLLVLIVLFSLHWVLVNELNRRYFVASYIVLGLMTLLYTEHAQLTVKARRLLTGFLFLIAFTGAASHFSYMLTIRPKSLQPAAEQTREFERYGRIGIIADYWLAYRHACVNPEMIKATPHDMSDVKNRALIADVFAQPRLFVLRDGWMQAFPDTLPQFKIPLIRVGKPFRIAGNDACEYRRLSLTHRYTINELTIPDETWKQDTSGQTVVRVQKGDDMKDRIVLSGPFCTLVPGNYSVTYRVKAHELPQQDSIIGEMLISAEYGAIPIKQVPVQLSVSQLGSYREFQVFFHLKSFTFNVEFLFRTKGNVALELGDVVLTEH